MSCYIREDRKCLACCLLHVVFLFGLLFDYKNGGDFDPSKRRLSSSGLNGFIAQNTELFITINFEFKYKSPKHHITLLTMCTIVMSHSTTFRPIFWFLFCFLLTVMWLFLQTLVTNWFLWWNYGVFSWTLSLWSVIYASFAPWRAT
jgi:hypothetical protein